MDEPLIELDSESNPNFFERGELAIAYNPLFHTFSYAFWPVNGEEWQEDNLTLAQVIAGLWGVLNWSREPELLQKMRQAMIMDGATNATKKILATLV